MDAHELQAIDELASRAGRSRSEYLVGAALAKKGGELLVEVARLQEMVNRLAGSIESRAAPIAIRDLEDAVARLVPILSRRDVPTDVKEQIRAVLHAIGVVW